MPLEVVFDAEKPHPFVTHLPFVLDLTKHLQVDMDLYRTCRKVKTLLLNEVWNYMHRSVQEERVQERFCLAESVCRRLCIVGLNRSHWAFPWGECACVVPDNTNFVSCAKNQLCIASLGGFTLPFVEFLHHLVWFIAYVTHYKLGFSPKSFLVWLFPCHIRLQL